MPRRSKSTGKRSARGKANPTSAWRVEHTLRALRATNLRAMGWAWADIAGSPWPLDADGNAVEGAGKLYADKNGNPCRQSAQAAVDRLLKQYAARDVDACRQEMVEQLDGLIAANMDAACGVVAGVEAGVGIADAVAAVKFAIERKAKLLGLDAPMKQEVTGKDGKPLFDGGEGLGSLPATAERLKAGHAPSGE